MPQYTPEEMMQFFQEGKVPEKPKTFTFGEFYGILEYHFLPAMVAHLNYSGINNINVHLEQVQCMDGTQTANVSFWQKHKHGNQWLQEFACTVDEGGVPYFMPVSR